MKYKAKGVTNLGCNYHHEQPKNTQSKNLFTLCLFMWWMLVCVITI